MIHCLIFILHGVRLERFEQRNLFRLKEMRNFFKVNSI